MADRKQLELARALLAGRVDRRDFLKQASAAWYFRGRGKFVPSCRAGGESRKRSQLPPLVAEPCKGQLPFAGQNDTVLVNTGGGEKGSIEGRSTRSAKSSRRPPGPRSTSWRCRSKSISQADRGHG